MRPDTRETPRARLADAEFRGRIPESIVSPSLRYDDRKHGHMGKQFRQYGRAGGFAAKPDARPRALTPWFTPLATAGVFAAGLLLGALA